MAKRILIVEDDLDILRLLKRELEEAGFEVLAYDSGMRGLTAVREEEPDLVILDLGLPDISGQEIARRVRRTGDTPILILTAADEVGTKVEMLNAGADDYLAKPFKFEELLARVRTRLRPRATAATADTVLTSGSLSLDLTTRIATVDGKQVELSAREFAMAREFLEHPGQVLSREQLLSRVWGFDFDGSSNVVDVYVRYLRTKLGAERFVTVRGVGYRLAVI